MNLTKKTLPSVLLVLSLAITSCGKSGSGSGSESSAPSASSENVILEDEDSVIGDTTEENIIGDVVEEEVDDSTKAYTTVPSLAISFSTSGVKYLNLTSTQITKYNKALAIVKKVVASSAFRNKVIYHRYNGYYQFANNGGKTNTQIYNSILNAAEELKPISNNTMDVGVRMYYANNSTVGYTSPSITYINVNTKYFNQYAVNEVACNLFHEWLHKVGYSHDSSPTYRRPYSVPYAIGYMIRDLGRLYL